MKCINHPMTDAIGVCVACGKPICEACKVESGGEIYCKKCIVEKASTTKAQQKKSPVLAAVLSFMLGGLGQIYNGQIWKGILIFFTAWLIIPWIYGIIDAYRIANKINSGEIEVPQRPGCAIAAIIVMIILPIFIAILGLLIAIAIPSFIAARDAAEADMCIGNLQYIDQVKQMYAAENGLASGAIISLVDYNGTNDGDGIPDVLEEYFEAAPKCPSGGIYDIGRVGEPATCSMGDNNTTAEWDDHILKPR